VENLLPPPRGLYCLIRRGGIGQRPVYRTQLPLQPFMVSLERRQLQPRIFVFSKRGNRIGGLFGIDLSRRFTYATVVSPTRRA